MEGWIHKTSREMYDETGLSRREQDTARKIGIDIGILETKRMGNPCTVNFRIDLEKSINLLTKFCEEEINEENNGKIPFAPVIKTKEVKVEDNRPPLEKMLSDKNRHIRIIGLWAKQTGIKVLNKEIMQSLIRRNLRAAVMLKGYEDIDIENTIRVLQNTDYLKKFTLETVGKFIDEVVKNKKSDGPAIIRYEQIQKSDGTIAVRPIYNK